MNNPSPRWRECIGAVARPGGAFAAGTFLAGLGRSLNRRSTPGRGPPDVFDRAMCPPGCRMTAASSVGPVSVPGTVREATRHGLFRATRGPACRAASPSTVWETTLVAGPRV